jgi:hypothetical protein
MNVKNMKLPIIIILIGMIIAVASCLFTGILKEPVVKEREFDYSVTYSVDGEVKTYKGSYRCGFVGYDGHDDPTLRLYDGVHKIDGNASSSSSFTVAQKDGVVLSIITELDAAYLMGDPDKYEYESGNEAPYLEAIDAEGYSVEISEVFGAEIISWEYPEPIENSFKFVGFSRLYAVSMLAMLLVAALTTISCMIFVKKDDGIEYKLLDKLSTALNFIISFAVIPFVTIVVALLPLTMDAGSLMYQIYLCIPAITAFTVAASIALRRKGYTMSGLLVQLVCPVLLFVQLFVASLVYNLFS